MTSNAKISQGVSWSTNLHLSWRDGDDMEDHASGSGVGGLNAPTNPLIAAAAAASLYGSGMSFFSFLILLLSKREH